MRGAVVNKSEGGFVYESFIMKDVPKVLEGGNNVDV